MPEKFISSELNKETVDSRNSTVSLSKEVLLELQDKHDRKKELKHEHEKIENQEHELADIDLKNNLNELSYIVNSQNLTKFITKYYPDNADAFDIAKEYLEKQNIIGITVTENELKEKINIFIEKKSDISTAEKIKNYKEQLSAQGKSQVEILQTLISMFENEEAVSTWVENWKNFLELHKMAANKPPAERKAIESIISHSDFSSENSFDLALSEINQSEEISAESKLEISRKFGGEHVKTVREMDSSLREVQNYQKEIDQAIDSKTKEAKQLEAEVDELNKQIAELDPNDPKQEEIKAKLTEKSKNLNQMKSEINILNEEKPHETSFILRENFSAKLNPDGSRSIRIDDTGFEIKLPDNTLFMGKKNLLSINLAFTYKTFNQLGMADLIYSPKIENGQTPDKQQRILANKILLSLGYNTGTILSQSEINQLDKDLSILKQKGNNTSGIEDLTALGIWDVSTQELNTNRLTTCLKFIRQNRGREVEFDEVKETV